jgi:outer membrane protein insertion porin family
MRRTSLCILTGFIVIHIVLLTSATDFPITTVETIEVVGNSEISTREILKAIQFQPGDEISAQELKTASQAIFDLGWFSEVLPEVVAGETIRFNVVENPVIKEIEISGNINRRPFKLFGLTLFHEPIMSKNRIRSILRTHDVKKRRILNSKSLQEAVPAILDAYEEKGYALIVLGQIEVGEVLRIEIIEGRVTANEIEGLDSIPEKVAHDFIDLPLGECVTTHQLSQIMQQMVASLYFTDVKLDVKQGPTPDSVRLVWILSEPTLIEAPVEIEQISLQGVTQFSPDRAAQTIERIPSQPIDNYQLLQLLENLHELYYQSGYVMVRFAVSKIEDTSLYLEVQEGKMGEILVEGNDRTKDYVIEKHLGFEEGDILNLSQVAATRQNLMSLGYFKSVNPVPEWVDDTVRLTIAITEEANLGGISGSLAYSPQGGGLVGKIDLSQKNLFGTGQDISFSYNRGLIGDQSAIWNLGYSTVSFFSAFNRVGFDLYRKSEEKTNAENETQSFFTIGGRASVSYPWSDYTDLGFSYKHEGIRAEEDSHWEPIDAIIASLNFDNTNHPYFPTTGDRLGVTLEQAGGFAAGAQYSKLDAHFVRFIEPRTGLPLGELENQALAVRFALGWGANLPASRTYDFGGSTTIRGSDTSAVSHLAYSNFEYRIMLVEGLNASLFFDAGFDLDRVTLPEAKASCGIELGIRVAGMYIRLDVAWPLTPDIDWIPKFDLGFGPIF